MTKTILEIFKEESNLIGVTQLELVKLTSKDCQILYGDSLNQHVEIFRKFRSPEIEIRETILLCMIGAALDEAVDTSLSN